MRVRQQLVASRKNVSTHPNGRKYVAVHQTGNTGRGANAAAHANLQSRPNPRVASWHWTVDAIEAVQSFPHALRTFHAGTALGNRDAISVELCVNSDGNYVAAVRNGAALVARILREERLPVSAVKQHHFFSGKDCPTQIRAGWSGITWAVFITLVSAELNPAAPTTPVVVAPPTVGTPSYGRINPAQQEQLEFLGFYDGTTFDGVHGPISVAGTKAFQSAHGLHVDGVMGPITTARLTKEYDMTAARIEKKVDELTTAIARLNGDRIHQVVGHELRNVKGRNPDGSERAKPFIDDLADTAIKVARRDLVLMLFELEDGRKGVQNVAERTWMLAPDDATLEGFLDVVRFQGYTVADSPWGNVRTWGYVRGLPGVQVKDVYRLGRQVEWKPEVVATEPSDDAAPEYDQGGELQPGDVTLLTDPEAREAAAATPRS